jgi:hypothetical protein
LEGNGLRPKAATVIPATTTVQATKKIHPALRRNVSAVIKCSFENQGLIAALEALRHPKASFSAVRKAEVDFGRLRARLKAAPFQEMTPADVFMK